jgi:chromosome segregation ATPase
MPEPKGIIEQDLSRAQAELLALDSKRTNLQWKIDYLKKLLGNIVADPDSYEGPPLEETASTAQKMRSAVYQKLTALDAIKEVLEDNDQGMKISEIAQDAIDGGYGGNADLEKIKAHFSTVVSRSISSDPEKSPFKRWPRAKIGLAKWPVPKNDENE